MSAARDQLVGRVKAINDILSNPISVDLTPVPPQNSSAVVIRNGCMVMLFCAIEGFIRERSLECAKAIDQAVVPYAHLPEGLKSASLIATFEGLLNFSRGLLLDDKIIEFEKAAASAAAGVLGSPYQFTDYSFAKDKSNLTAEDVSKIAKAFGVENFWAAARAVSAKVGIAIPGNMSDAFRQMAKERHRAAHVSSHNVPHNQLTATLPQVLALAISFDSLISTATSRLSKSSIAHGISPAPVTDLDVDFIEVRPHLRGRWGAFVQSRGRALFLDSDGDLALTRAINEAKKRAFSVVRKDGSGRPSNWRTLLG